VACSVCRRFAIVRRFPTTACRQSWFMRQPAGKEPRKGTEWLRSGRREEREVGEGSTAAPNERRAEESNEHGPDPEPSADRVSRPAGLTSEPPASGEAASDSQTADPEVQHE
jgi:hypothetical protein